MINEFTYFTFSLVQALKSKHKRVFPTIVLKNIFLFVLLLLLFPFSIFSQEYAKNVVLMNSWPPGTPSQDYFYSVDSLGLHQDTIIGRSYTISNFNYFRYAVYSNKNGELKLYSDGRTAWNSQHQVIKYPLIKNTNVSTPLNCNFALPMPDNSRYIYIFTMKQLNFNPDELYYSLVDLMGNNGQGSVLISGQKLTNIGLSKGIGVANHSNGRDFWVVVKKYMSREFMSFRIKPGGQMDTVLSMAGNNPVNTQLTNYGFMKISPNGRWLADISNTDTDTVQILSFDASSGVVSDSNMVLLPKYKPYWTVGYIINVAFSPDSRRIYSFDYSDSTYVHQFDLTATNQQNFSNSRKTIKTFYGTMGTSSILEPLIDNKIYNPGSTSNSGTFFNTIENPNLSGSNCNWMDSSYIVNSNMSFSIFSQFPIFPGGWLMQPLDISYTHSCAGENIPGTHFAFSDSVTQAFWNFQDSLTPGPDTSSLFYPTHKFSQAGTYHIWAKALHYGMWDSIAKTIVIYQSPQIDIGIDTTLTGHDTIVLDPGGGFVSYEWNTGDTTQTLMICGSQMSAGAYTYWVEVTDTNGCSAKAYRTITYSNVGIKNNKKAQWKLYPNPANDIITIELPWPVQHEMILKVYNQSGALVKKCRYPENINTFQVSLKGLSKGIYWLELDGEQRKYRQKVVKR